MSRVFGRRTPEVAVARGERVLARASVTDGDVVVAGTREALYLGGRRLPWELVHAASWDAESGVLTVTEVAPSAHSTDRPVQRLALEAPDRLLQLVRERVTASLVAQRAVPLPHGSARVVARRAAGGERAVTWHVEYDDDADPADPAVADLVERALREARADLGGD